MEKIIDTLNELIKDRISNPLTSTFAISWCLWNYKFLMILLSDNTVVTTIQLIKEHSFPNILQTIIYGFALPLISSLIYIFAYPYPSREIYKFTLRRKQEILASRNEIEKHELLTLEESQRLRRIHAQEKQQLRDSLIEKEAENNALISELSELKQKIEKNQQNDEIYLNNENIEDSKDIEIDNKLKLESMGFLEFLVNNADFNGFISMKKIRELSNFAHPTNVAGYLSYLCSEQLISRHEDTATRSTGFIINDQGNIKASKFRYAVDKKFETSKNKIEPKKN